MLVLHTSLLAEQSVAHAEHAPVAVLQNGVLSEQLDALHAVHAPVVVLQTGVFPEQLDAVHAQLL
ncbi:MAG: hypothetical protein WCK42_08920 [Myxococcaceae bacterium]